MTLLSKRSGVRWLACAGLLFSWGGLQPWSAGVSFGQEKPSTEAAKAPEAAVTPPLKVADSIGDAGRAKLISDTHKLLILSREVQAEMAKNGPDTLSLGMLKKIEQLQKLAASVRAEMTKKP